MRYDNQNGPILDAIGYQIKMAFLPVFLRMIAFVIPLTGFVYACKHIIN